MDVGTLKLVGQVQLSDMCAEVVLVKLSDHFGIQVKVATVVNTQNSDVIICFRIGVLDLMRQTSTHLLHQKYHIHPGIQ